MKHVKKSKAMRNNHQVQLKKKKEKLKIIQKSERDFKEIKERTDV